MSLRACVLTILLLSAVGAARGGAVGWAMYLLGAATSGLNLWAWRVMVGLAGRVAVETDSPAGGTLLVFLAFLMKLPVVVAIYYASKRLGGEASSCFLGGLVLVYFALVAWGLGKSKEPPHDSNGRSH